MNPETGSALLPGPQGTMGYLAPEITSQVIPIVTPAIDIWAFGIVLYIMAVAYFPSMLRQYSKTEGKEILYHDRDWSRFSPALREVVEGCLQLDPANRLTSKQLKDHPWFRDS